MLDAPNWYARKYNSVLARTRESDPDAEFHIRQIGAERHASRLATIDYGDAFVLDLQDKGGIAMSGAINDDALTAVFLWGEGTRFNGERADVPQLRILGPGTEFRLEMPGSYRLMRIGLRGASFDSLSEASAVGPDRRRWLTPGVFERGISAKSELELQRLLLRTAGFAQTAALRGGDFSASLGVAASEAGAALTQALFHTEAHGDRRLATGEQRRIVDAALAIFETHPHGPVSVGAVCAALGIGERMLERAFHDCLGVSPRAYERERRLRAAHGLILTGGSLSITDIAMRFGFWHLGRFAGAYAALFGCSPSETRRNIRQDLSSNRAA